MEFLSATGVSKQSSTGLKSFACNQEGWSCYQQCNEFKIIGDFPGVYLSNSPNNIATYRTIFF